MGGEALRVLLERRGARVAWATGRSGLLAPVSLSRCQATLQYKTMTLADRLRDFLDRHRGVLPLKPCLVPRGYRGGGRLAGKGPGCVRRNGKYLVERWIASSTRAGWGDPNTQNGLSHLAEFRPATRLAEAVQALPDVLLGPGRAAAHAGQFRVLTKILDPYDPIGFHFHQKDETVRADPAAFPGEFCGKDEAYYFLQCPKGAWPYTHVGILPEVTREQLVAAMSAGREALLEISPYFLQRPGTGFFVPAGLVHSPGTVLTLEIQQPSDVGASFGLHTRGHDLADPIALEAAAQQVLRHVDLDLCRQPDILQRFAINPIPVEPSSPGLECSRIVPPSVTPKFSAQRLVARQPCTYRVQDCFALLVWSGQGTVQGHLAQRGCEFFVSHRAASDGIRIEPGAQGLECFAVFAAAT
jgi:hypothetical protein